MPLVLKTDTEPHMTKYLTSSACKSLLLVLVFAILSITGQAQEISSDPAAISAGKALFNSNCKSCHKVQSKVVGPALAGVYDRAPSIDWIISFIHNPSKVIASGDPYATQLYEQYKPTMMTAFSNLKDEDIMNILAYIKAEATAPPTNGTLPPGTPVNVSGTQNASSTYLNVILIGLVIILVLMLVVLGFLVSAIKRFLDQKDLAEEDRDVVSNTITLSAITRSPGFLFVVVFLIAGLGAKAVINGLYSIGIQQGYAPKQPIAFSHKIHAGQYEIDCKYCHVGVTKGKSATIPSVNICMNCHNQIKSGTLTGEGQIRMITEAFEKKQPIEWVRIHNLPDLAYFNHAQHVVVGGVECQTCHGPIETMDVVRQHSLLTMGWCIDCHRKTDIDTTKNKVYYDKMLEIHNSKGKKPFKVEDIGGLECSKCHY